MRYILENDFLRVEADSFGAELKSVISKKDNREYLWQADKTFWGRTSPVLFPFVGSMKNKEFILNGRHYPMGQHGFARDMEHSLTSRTEDTLWFQLSSNDETKDRFPFDFLLEIGYRLTGNCVKVLWRVTNPSGETLPFSIGAHPAFNCPACGEESKEGYRISFAKYDENQTLIPLREIHHHGNTLDTGLAITEDITLPLENGQARITPDFFDRCTYMIEGNQANSVGLVDRNGRQFITVLFDTPLFAIWSPEKKNAPFICIEPWYGRCDHVDFDGDLFAREYTNLLDAGQVFEASYTIQFQ